jgi:DNA polymerase-3 subunit delta'
MYFKDVIGQQTIKDRLIGEAREQRIPHALMFCGPQGSGKLPLTIAYARYICCEHPTDHDACGTCQSCKLFDKYIHPDVHFVYPVIKKKGDPLSQDYINEWRELIQRAPYFNINHWLEAMNAANQQPMIYVKESDEIVRKLSYKSMLGGYKVVIIWLPEKMNTECANKILKILEEPPHNTVFLLVSNNREDILPTIQSRTQPIKVLGIADEPLKQALVERFGITDDEAADIVKISNGSFLEARQQIEQDEENTFNFENFKSLMRTCYSGDVISALAFAKEIAKLSRERQKSFIDYCLIMVRENFARNINSNVAYLTKDEDAFAKNFSRFINERNINNFITIFNDSYYQIERNGNSEIIFTDTAFNIMKIIRK